MSVMKNSFAQATIPDDLPAEFAIYDLNEFLAAYSLSDECDIGFNESFLSFELGGEVTEYNYASPSVVVSPGDKEITMPSIDKTFTLTKEVFEKIMKVSSILKLRDLTIDCKGITILNRNTIGNKHKIKITIDCPGENTVSNIKVENLKLLPIDYSVSISNKGIARFTSLSEEYKVEYHIALEAID